MNNSYTEELDRLNKFRNSLIKVLNEEKNSPEKIQDLDNKVDELTKEILAYIKLYFNDLPFEFIMEQLSYIGWCPNLLNDDNGHWALATDGFQNVVVGDEPEDVDTSFFVEAKYWKDTSREALNFYLNEE